MAGLFAWTMPRIVPQTPADQDQDSAGEEEVTTNPTAAAGAKAAVVLAMVGVRMAGAEAAILAGTVAVVVGKEVDRMAEDNHTTEVEANKVVVVPGMVSNNSTKVNKVAILDSCALGCGVNWRKGKTDYHSEIPN